MYKNYLLIILSSLLTACCGGLQEDKNGNANTSGYMETENLPESFRDFKVGIVVIHEPDTIYAEPNNRGNMKFIWRHTTTVKATVSDLTITEFGTYNYRGGKWVLGNHTKRPFTVEDFDKWYCRKKNGIITFDFCQGGKICKNEEFIDPSNFSIRKDSLISRNGLWYFVGIDSAGEKHMGYGRYVIVPEIKK